MELDHDKIRSLLDELETRADDAESAADEARNQAQDVVGYAEDASARASELSSAAERLNKALSDGAIGELLDAKEKFQELQEQRDEAAATLKGVLVDLGARLIEAKELEAVKREAETRQATDAAQIKALQDNNAHLEKELATLKGLIKVETQKEESATAAD